MSEGAASELAPNNLFLWEMFRAGFLYSHAGLCDYRDVRVRRARDGTRAVELLRMTTRPETGGAENASARGATNTIGRAWIAGDGFERDANENEPRITRLCGIVKDKGPCALRDRHSQRSGGSGGSPMHARSFEL